MVFRQTLLTYAEVLDRETLFHRTCLFIICLETLAISVRGYKSIQGILVDKEEIKLEMFAGDFTAFLRNSSSLEALLHTGDLFSKCSGLEINSEKTECMVLGNLVSVLSGDECYLIQKDTGEGHDQNFRCLFYI